MIKRILISLSVVCICMGLAAWIGWQRGEAQSPAGGPVPEGQVAAHIVGRMLVDQYGNAQLIGYFPYLANLPVAFFSGTPSEVTAYFTFRSPTFQLQSVQNGSILELFSQPASPGTNPTLAYNIYLNATPHQDFTNPDTFSQGKLIASFNTVKWMATATAGGGLMAGTITLISSADFTVQGQTYNLGNLGDASTIVFTFGSSPNGLTFPLVIPFGGYAQQAASLSPRLGSFRR